MCILRTYKATVIHNKGKMMNTNYAEQKLIAHGFKVSPVTQEFNLPCDGGYHKANIVCGIVELRQFDRLGLPMMEVVRFNVDDDNDNSQSDDFADYMFDTFGDDVFEDA